MPAEKVRCACGCYVGKFYMNKHKKTKKHLKLLEINQPLTLDNIMKAMNELEEKIDDMCSGEYLLECNRLKSIYDRLNRTENMRVDNNDISSIIMILFG
jgi:hypothetical protein